MLVSHKRRNGFFGLSNLLNHTAGRRWVAKATATSRGSRTQIIHGVWGNARKMRSQNSVLALRSFKTYLPPACPAQSFPSNLSAETIWSSFHSCGGLSTSSIVFGSE